MADTGVQGPAATGAPATMRGRPICKARSGFVDRTTRRFALAAGRPSLPFVTDHSLQRIPSPLRDVGRSDASPHPSRPRSPHRTADLRWCVRFTATLNRRNGPGILTGERPGRRMGRRSASWQRPAEGSGAGMRKFGVLEGSISLSHTVA